MDFLSLLRARAAAVAAAALLGLGGLPLAVQAQTAAPACPPPAPTLNAEAIAQAQRDVRDRGLLWRAEKDGRTSWLYGTLHLSRLEWLVAGPQLQRAFRASEVLALELNPLDAESLKALTDPADPALVQRLLTEPRRSRLARAVERACVPPQAFDNLRPALRVSALTALMGRHIGLHPEFAVDTVLAAGAQRQKKPIVALETAAQQLQLLAGRNEAEEGTLVDGALDELESGAVPAMLTTLSQAWADGDEHKLATYPDWCQCIKTDADRQQMQRLLDDRNGPMADKVAALH
ncbi:MAG: TraB/GumN family protein, partial [Pseudomonadota bacterium]